MALSGTAAVRAAGPQHAQAPPLLLDQPLRAVEYQLSRLTNDELLRAERRPHEERYRPIYVALLTRGGLPRDVSEEALAALVGMDETSPTRVLLETLGKIDGGADRKIDGGADRKIDGGADLQVGPYPPPASERLLTLLFAESAEELQKHRDVLLTAAASGSSPVRQGAYGALMLADGKPTAAWATAADAGHLADVLRSVPQLPAADLRQQLFEPIAALIRAFIDPAIRTEALTALGWTRADRPAFALLAAEVVSPGPASTHTTRGAAVRSIRRVPASAWPADDLEPLARALVAWLRSLPAADRTQPDALEAMLLGRDLAALSGTRGRALTTDLAALEVRIVRIATLPAEMRFDLNWFVVQAGRSVEIVFTNTDAMPHNLVVGRPGAVEALGTVAAAMSMPVDRDVKPFVPDSPLVIDATPLLQDGQTARLSFTAPSEPGEYVYVCTFPGHWMRMYGVMLVVPSLDAWKASPMRPTDPLTGQPFERRDGDGGADPQGEPRPARRQ